MSNTLPLSIQWLFNTSLNLVKGNAMVLTLFKVLRLPVLMSRLRALEIYILNNVFNQKHINTEEHIKAPDADFPKTLRSIIEVFVPITAEKSGNASKTFVKRCVDAFTHTLRLVLDVLIKNQVMSVIFALVHRVLSFIIGKMISNVTFGDLTSDTLAKNNAMLIAVSPIAPYLSMMSVVTYAVLFLYTAKDAIHDRHKKEVEDKKIDGINNNQYAVIKFISIPGAMILSASSELLHIFGKEMLSRKIYSYVNIKELANLSILENALRMMVRFAPKTITLSILAAAGLFFAPKKDKAEYAVLIAMGLALLSFSSVFASPFLAPIISELVANMAFYVILGAAIALSCVLVNNIATRFVTDRVAAHLEKVVVKDNESEQVNVGDRGLNPRAVIHKVNKNLAQQSRENDSQHGNTRRGGFGTSLIRAM